MLFISYASHDSSFVQSLSSVIRSAGIDTWVDRENLSPGDRWRGEVMTAIETCTVFVVVLSQASASSREVRREVEAADRREKRIIPIIKEACDPRSMELVLAERHWIDFSTGDPSGGARQLVDALQGRSAERPVSPMARQPVPNQIVGAWQVWMQHPVLPGFGNFQFHQNGFFTGQQSQSTGTVQIEGQWAFDGSQLHIQGMTNLRFPYGVLLHIIENGRGYFKASSHDGFAVLFQWAG
jgi:TIR domain